MWDDLSLDLLSHILSYLPLSSLIPCLLVSKHWHSAAAATTTTSSSYVLIVPTRSLSAASFTTFPPLPSSSSSLPLHFLPSSPSHCLVASTPSLLFTLSPSLLLLCNPFTRRFSLLPPPRSSNPAIALIPSSSSSPHSFRIVAAGGANGSSYQQTVDVFNTNTCEWTAAAGAPMSLEFAVRLTVWTPRESAYSAVSGVLYWMTSTRVYSVVGYSEGRWREVKVPMAERLEWAGLVGGLESGEGFVWELVVEEWVVVGVVPARLKERRSVKGVVGSEGVVYLVGEGDPEEEEGNMVILVGREREWGKIEWTRVEERGVCCMGKGPIKAVMVQPCLSSSPMIERLKRIAANVVGTGPLLVSD